MSIIFNGHYRMKHRTWITEALRLHFEEHLPRVVAGRRLGVPKSTVCSMFVRFRRAGLSWPLPAGMSEQELDACLYGQFSTVPVVRPESTVISEAPVVKKRPRRPNFPYEFKIALVEQSLQPGACVAQVYPRLFLGVYCSQPGFVKTSSCEIAWPLRKNLTLFLT